jgi:hypothetical protein
MIRHLHCRFRETHDSETCSGVYTPIAPNLFLWEDFQVLKPGRVVRTASRRPLCHVERKSPDTSGLLFLCKKLEIPRLRSE